ncbi:unnamed protein product [Brassica oleracea]
MRFFFDIVYLIQQDIAQEHIKTFINLLFVRRGEDDGFIATGEETRFRLSSCFSVCSLFCRFVSYLSLYIYNLYLQLFSASSCAYYVLSLLESRPSILTYIQDDTHQELVERRIHEHERILRMNSRDYGHFSPKHKLHRPPSKLIPN